MTRPMTRGDIFRQQAIRCARAVFAAPPATLGSRAAPPASTESNVVEFRRRSASAAISHPRPRTDVFPAEPPPHIGPRHARASVPPGPRRRGVVGGHRQDGRGDLRREGGREAVALFQVQERDGRQAEALRATDGEARGPVPRVRRRGQGGVPAMSRPRAHELPRPGHAPQDGVAGVVRALPRLGEGALRSVSGPGKLQGEDRFRRRGRIAPY